MPIHKLRATQVFTLIRKYKTGKYTQKELSKSLPVTPQRISIILIEELGVKGVKKIKDKRHKERIIELWGSVARMKRVQKIRRQVKAGDRWCIKYLQCKMCKERTYKHWAHGICHNCKDAYQKEHRIAKYKGRKRHPELDKI
jgi:hypothetical protein|tara:strand:+ start:614 stop:1039 length:426 start_codon:yes stop_codon:yes gene_type:complete